MVARALTSQFVPVFVCRCVLHACTVSVGIVFMQVYFGRSLPNAGNHDGHDKELTMYISRCLALRHRACSSNLELRHVIDTAVELPRPLHPEH